MQGESSSHSNAGDKRTRLDLWHCSEAFDDIGVAIGHLWAMESDRVKRFENRTEPLAVKADGILWRLREERQKLADLIGDLEIEEEA